MKRALDSVLHLFFPPVCPVCGEVMSEVNMVMCARCQIDMPLTGYWVEAGNPVEEKFWGHIPIQRACSFMFYSETGRFKRIIHLFKYHGGWRLARQMGRWYGSCLREGGLYGDVDIVMAVPLHWWRRLRRGYNQSDYIAEGIAGALGLKVDRRSVRRHVNNPSQTLSHPEQRWDNVKGIFRVRHHKALEGKHILLVDDVLTTGATVISCAEAILAAVPNARISIATLAVSKKGLKAV